MRAILVGTSRDRERLRPDLERRGIDVVAEFDTRLEASSSGLVADVTIAAAEALPVAWPDDRLAIAEELTPREVQVLELLAEGLPNRGIADRLGISDQTVKYHVASIMGKLGTSNRVETVRRAVRQGLITI
jgi:DNA-binding NarL/FixJ family response regulator